MPRSILRGLILSACLCMLSGCGDGSGRVAASGTVTLKGEPLDGGTIEFQPVDPEKGSANGGLIRNGKYAIPREKGLLPGTYRILISAGEPGTVVEEEAPGASARPEARDRIPPAWNKDSKHTVEVKKGDRNEFNFKID